MTRILAFSDLAWGVKMRGSSGNRRVDASSFLRVVRETDPAIVVFAGDAAYDRCSRAEPNETDRFIGLLRHLVSAGRHCIVVEGNNDDSIGTYNRVRDAAEASPYLHEVSSRTEAVRGIRFLGVPTGNERRMAESVLEAVDIVVAHAPYANRTWLFDLPAACIITGHYGTLVGEIAGKAYISLDCSPFSYAVIDWQQGWRRIEYAAVSATGTCRIEVHREDGFAGATGTGCGPAELRRLTEGEGPIPYRDEIEALRRAKSEIAIFGREEVFGRLLGRGIPKTHIERYLGRRQVMNRHAR
ncbi:hypothetical protein ABH15_09885 [Methanoculleus taiwanensis]|uniref:Calcineurin-like phosphoesterase domain-containing protein n=1 Tax=Methanoculleus taiwanensis TaxID=1550565 RepID=A0A498H2Q9_9EURY|nr:metallophosphoesterase [Methanoculleus taiwanensis]RXE56390.1 hypothetical protein ABH15_09885 [Methanoculleus taiwanensis]